ncbi:hypothetical protein SEQ_HALENA_61 [Mycobacterium phage Halena]|uniref:Uncharacterized protein n=5 Tax=Bronvirus TaxID=1623278 RepID=E0YPJ5_9CAUD|nr:Erf-like ssDNA annealing protein [Mycobacterium phage LeBron]YP_010105462.1 Erf-like ssDNA annealing protein [Mycobacterium phage DirkDirk]YP_010114761.1 Erf-like ssDNA annealing protein [Mycobacterium phage OhShagHennessy]AEK07597.1 hypothetical protein UPIE_63 [Mycobacterium phage UPIE]ASR86046.1 hypothetical protein SEA_APPLETREE2_63 [Mycobacterium phage Appletree2]QBP29845.1 hypothetical protein SEQ_HALENA_61 [Mycobacterium phage Halena]ADL71026.1 hypothetical protein LEBRON_62 [Mycoba
MRGMSIPCDTCGTNEAQVAVGLLDPRLVCNTCLEWGDHRRWWNKLPRQLISKPSPGPRFALAG